METQVAQVKLPNRSGDWLEQLRSSEKLTSTSITLDASTNELLLIFGVVDAGRAAKNSR
jgi:hypothetical protein